MCGIVGWTFAPQLAAFEGLIEQAASRLERRGPDGQGTWRSSDGIVSFGHRRLSVLDVSSAGNQPMHSECGRYSIVFNGEIYNHLTLRERLEQSGETPSGGWRSTSDTETLLVAIRAWGMLETLKAASGMFALAVWDAKNKLLHLARDRFGEKPLYVARLGTGLAFASELKALVRLPGFDGAIDTAAQDDFLRHGYVRAPATIYRSVNKVLPGSLVTLGQGDVDGLDRQGDFLAPARSHYWRLQDVALAGQRDPFQGDETEAVDELERVLSHAVKAQELSDVPLGAFLSGGIDSSMVVALMQAGASRPVRTFTIGFDDQAYDEAPFAEAVAKHLGTDHTCAILSPDEAMHRIQLVPQVWDEPFADVSQLPTLLVSEVARRDVTVALSGDGGDELFGGYDRYDWTERIWGKLKWAPGPIRKAMASAMRAVPTSAWDRLFELFPRRGSRRLSGDRLHKLAAIVPADGPTALYEAMTSAWRESTPLLVGDQPLKAPHWSGYPSWSSLTETLMFRDAVDYMPDDIFVKVDRAAMSVSLETRAPLLDPEVAALSWRLPLRYKVAEGKGKWILRKLLHRYVPAELIDRPKRGFAVPVDDWLRGPMRDWAEELLDPKALLDAGIRSEPIRRAWQVHLAGTENHRYFLWHVLMYMAWRRTWVLGRVWD